ncbi:nucleotide-binding protein [Thermococcus guaymasensis DSM 11113]|uniref:Nucleotide-binding protein n=1 Tax=Thermococcus guaymasensis DSM 11113 TaxID=1432656 RepID=A0A0X1KHP7_9EURY|nr:type II toxin-antitoxin system VapC family toxin [Thermococcus guaymasensis]AJC70785.1 nucleotide-binding protein [Thermococcus guaymasensis DSM 11113]
MIVIDASALVKVVLQEPGWEEVPTEPHVATLDYALVEGMNAIWKAVRRGELTTEQGRVKVTVLKTLGSSITLFDARSFFERGLEIAFKENITIYDALYIALAEALKAKLLTADEKQYYAAKNYVEARLIR